MSKLPRPEKRPGGPHDEEIADAEVPSVLDDVT
jgi:hypothetical protein